MNANWKLYGNLLETFERILYKIGIWPRKDLPAVRIIITIILSIFVILCIMKMIINPERESIENALANCLGLFMMVIFYIWLTYKADEFIEVVDFIKSDMKREPSDIEKKNLGDGVKEIQTVIKLSLFILPNSCVVKFIMPFVEYGYAIAVHGNGHLILPPAMALPILPIEFYGELLSFIIEWMNFTLMMNALFGAAILFVILTVYINVQFKTLADELEILSIDDKEKFYNYIQRHQKLLELS